MYKIKIFTVGKTKEAWLQEGLNEYTKRLKPFMSIEWSLAKNSDQLNLFLEKEPHYVSLDPAGRSYSSEKFSEAIHSLLLKEGSRLSFVIGGAEGINPTIKSKSSLIISLSPLTFTHQMTRLVLLEQLYRASEIDRGTAYHK